MTLSLKAVMVSVKAQGSNMAYIVLNNTVNTLGLPTITLKSEQKPFIFVIDTGSNSSHLDKAAANLLRKVPKDVIPAIPTSGITGQLSSEGRITPIFTSDIFSFEYPLLITDLSNIIREIKEAGGPEIHGILGTDFLSKYRCHLDFKKNRLHLG